MNKIRKTFIFTILLLLFIIMVAKTESSIPTIGSIAPTKTTVAATQTPFFNSLPGNPDPAQVEVVYFTTIKHSGIKSKSTDSNIGSNKNYAIGRGNMFDMFNIVLIISLVAAAVMLGGLNLDGAV
jgi:hypothetical protein